MGAARIDQLADSNEPAINKNAFQYDAYLRSSGRLKSMDGGRGSVHPPMSTPPPPATHPTQVHAGIHTPPFDEQTNMSKNITFASQPVG